MKYVTFLMISITIGCYSIEPEKTGLEGQIIPSFKLLLLDSTTYLDTKNISSGKPIVLLYIGPHCPYSHLQMEEILDEMGKLKNINFIVFTNWPFTDMQEFHTHYQLNKHPNITTGIDSKSFFANHFKAPGVPYMAIYGKNKKLIKVFAGRIFANQIKKVAEK
jgi:hypothetical protein